MNVVNMFLVTHDRRSKGCNNNNNNQQNNEINNMNININVVYYFIVYAELL